MPQRKMIESMVGIFVFLLTTKVEISHFASGFPSPLTSYTNKTLSDNTWFDTQTQGTFHHPNLTIYNIFQGKIFYSLYYLLYTRLELNNALF